MTQIIYQMLDLETHFILKDITGSFVVNNTLTSHTGTVKGWNVDTQQLDVTFEDIKRINMELSTDFSLPFILEDQDSANNENNILMEDIQLVDTTINDNIVLDGTNVTLNSYKICKHRC